jgi:PIN domain nuclease of toxin-antitoxin system
MTYVIDTHVLVWFAEGDSRLSTKAKDALSDKSVQIVVPTIVLAEVWYLNSVKRIHTSVQDLYQDILSSTNCHIHPLDEEIINHLPERLNIHDAIITATAIFYRDVLAQDVKLVTKDKMIHDSKLIDALW